MKMRTRTTEKRSVFIYVCWGRDFVLCACADEFVYEYRRGVHAFIEVWIGGFGAICL